MNHDDISRRLALLRDRFHRSGSDNAVRRTLLAEMELLADQLSYDDSGYDHDHPTPVLPPRHDRLDVRSPPTGASGARPL